MNEGKTLSRFKEFETLKKIINEDPESGAKFLLEKISKGVERRELNFYLCTLGKEPFKKIQDGLGAIKMSEHAYGKKVELLSRYIETEVVKVREARFAKAFTGVIKRWGQRAH